MEVEESAPVENINDELRTLRERVDYHKYYLSDVLNKNLAEAFSRVKNDLHFIKQLHYFHQEQVVKNLSQLQNDFHKEFEMLTHTTEKLYHQNSELRSELKKQLKQLDTTKTSAKETERLKESCVELHTQLHKHIHTTEQRIAQQNKYIQELITTVTPLTKTSALDSPKLSRHKGSAEQSLAQSPLSQSLDVVRAEIGIVRTSFEEQLNHQKQEILTLLHEHQKRVTSLKEDIDELHTTMLDKSSGKKEMVSDKAWLQELEIVKQELYDLQQTRLDRALFDELRSQVDQLHARVPLRIKKDDLAEASLALHAGQIVAFEQKTSTLAEEVQLLKQEVLRLLQDQNRKVASLKEDLDELETLIMQKSNPKEGKEHKYAAQLSKDFEKMKETLLDVQNSLVSRSLLDELHERLDTIEGHIPLKAMKGAGFVSKKDFEKNITSLTEKVNTLREELDTVEKEFNLK